MNAGRTSLPREVLELAVAEWQGNKCGRCGDPIFPTILRPSRLVHILRPLPHKPELEGWK